MTGTKAKQPEERGKTDAKKDDTPPRWGNWKRMGKYLSGAVLIGAAVVTLWRLNACEPQVEGPRTTITTQVDAGPVEEPEPQANDGKCERGERYHRSAIFDNESCGYCGDGIIQLHEEGQEGSTGTEEVQVEIDGRTVTATVQYVSDPDRAETEESCPADYYFCGDGRLTKRTSFPVVRDIDESEDGENYVLRIVERSESCRTRSADYCAADCGGAGAGSGGGTGRVSGGSGRVEGSRPPTPPPGGQVGACVGSNASGARQVGSRIARQVTSSAPTIKQALGAPNVPVMVNVSVYIDASGVPSIRGASATCSGQRCPQSANILAIAGLSVSGITATNDGTPCMYNVSVPLN